MYTRMRCPTATRDRRDLRAASPRPPTPDVDRHFPRTAIHIPFVCVVRTSQSDGPASTHFQRGLLRYIANVFDANAGQDGHVWPFFLRAISFAFPFLQPLFFFCSLSARLCPPCCFLRQFFFLFQFPFALSFLPYLY